MDDALLDRLRSDLGGADYHVGAVRALLGSAADDARLRGVFTPARRALESRECGPLATLTRLLLLGEPVPGPELDLALPCLGAAGAATLGLVRMDAEGCRARLSLNPVELPDPAAGGAEELVHWWILSDLDDQLRAAPARPDHVMGVGGATRSLLAQLPIGQSGPALDGDMIERDALDLGTGCGAIALALARAGVRRVVASDISERALLLARANARLNGLHERIEFRHGDLFAAVAGERFDLIASNPPFVITPRAEDAHSERYEYRDAGMVGDELAARVVREAIPHLRDGGTLICLANWESPWAAAGLDRVREWLREAGQRSGPIAAWVIERDRLDPVRYAETWVRDGGARPGEPEFDCLLGGWLDDFSARRIVSIGLGSIRVLKLDAAAGTGAAASTGASSTGASNTGASNTDASNTDELIRTEYLPDPLAGPHPGLEFGRILERAARLASITDAQLLTERWLRAASLSEWREHAPGEEAPRAILLRIDHPVARSVRSDPLLAAAVGACDGELTLAQISDALATILEVDAAACAEALTTGVRELVWFGMLEPAAR